MAEVLRVIAVLKFLKISPAGIAIGKDENILDRKDKEPRDWPQAIACRILLG